MPVGVLFVWLIVGLIAAFVTRKSTGGVPPFGLVGDMIIGAAGGVVGGYALALFMPRTNLGLILTVVAAIAVAAILILLSGKIRKTNGES